MWLRQLMFPEQNRASVFARMKAERGRIAMRHRSEGGREFKKLIAAGERQKGYILAEAYKEAEGLKGAGDAEAMRIYAKAFRTLEGYEKILDATPPFSFLPTQRPSATAIGFWTCLPSTKRPPR